MNYTDSVPLTLEKNREKILTLGPPQEGARSGLLPIVTREI